MKLGSKFSDALRLWEGKDGEAARAACFKREVQQLSFKGRRVLFAMSRADSASLPELCHFAELERVEVEQAIQELDQLFLCSSEEIAGEPRFLVAENLRRLLEEEKRDLVPEHVQIERRVSALRKAASGGGKSRGKNAPIAAAINQAMAQLGNGDARGACQTVDEALQGAPDSADLWMVKARCYAEIRPPDSEIVRTAFEKSYQLGKREARLFEKWIDFELNFGNLNAAVDVGEKGLAAADVPSYFWLEKVSGAYFGRAQQRLRRGENEDAAQDFRNSLKLLHSAYIKAPTPARPSISAAIERSGEGRWLAMPLSRGVGSAIDVLRTARDCMQCGDQRAIWVDRMLISLHPVMQSTNAKVSGTEIELLKSLIVGSRKYVDSAAQAKLDLALERLDSLR
jgi:tetratricopeptide (TPR) repeat protein